MPRVTRAAQEPNPSAFWATIGFREPIIDGDRLTGQAMVGMACSCFFVLFVDV